MIFQLQETHFSFKGTHKLKVKGQREILHKNSNQKRTEWIILTLDKKKVKSKIVMIQRKVFYNDKGVNSSRRYKNYRY